MMKVGDRISFSFINGDRESVAFFAHWAGRWMLASVESYWKELNKELDGSSFYPLQRLEPNTVMLDFIKWFFSDSDARIWSSFYLGKDDNDGDNSDNGHWIFDLQKGEWVH